MFSNLCCSLRPEISKHSMCQQLLDKIMLSQKHVDHSQHQLDVKYTSSFVPFVKLQVQALLESWALAYTAPCCHEWVHPAVLAPNIKTKLTPTESSELDISKYACQFINRYVGIGDVWTRLTQQQSILLKGQQMFLWKGRLPFLKPCVSNWSVALYHIPVTHMLAISIKVFHDSSIKIIHKLPLMSSFWFWAFSIYYSPHIHLSIHKLSTHFVFLSFLCCLQSAPQIRTFPLLSYKVSLQSRCHIKCHFSLSGTQWLNKTLLARHSANLFNNNNWGLLNL